MSSPEFYKLPQWEQSRIVAEYIIHNRQQEIEMYETRQEGTSAGVDDGN